MSEEKLKNEEIFFKQAQLMEQASILFGNRIKQIEQNSKQNEVIKVFQTRSLDFYKDTLNFLDEEVKKEEPKRYVFLLPNIRTLFDIYARFLHLVSNCKDDNKRALTCIAYQLLSSKFLSEVSNNNSFYEEVLNLNKNFLNEIKFDFPKNLTEFDFRWIKERDLAFASKKELLTSDCIKKYSIYTIEVFGIKETYKIYSFFSELLHGNPYAYNKEPGNERFWIVSTSLINSALLIELIDKEILKRTNPRDFRIWLNDIKENQKPFSDIWTRQRMSNIKLQ